MATLRCPRCSTLVSAAPGGTASCPNCGFTAQVPGAPPPAAPPPPPAAVAPSPAPAPPPPNWPAADWTAAKPAPSQPVPSSAGWPLSPMPATAPAPAWGQRGKKVEPAFVAVLAVVTLGVYSLFYWWRVSREADLLKGHRHAHGLAKTGILMAVLGGLVAMLFLVVVLLQAATLLDPGSEPTEQEIVDAVEQAAVPYLAIIVVAALVAAAGGIVLCVAMWRSWTTIRGAELAVGRADTVNPALYLFLPLALSLAAGVLDAVVALGAVLRLASFVLTVAFMAITQSHLNRLWDTGVPAPAPAPVAR